jgi:hypothetical protein
MFGNGPYFDSFSSEEGLKSSTLCLPRKNCIWLLEWIDTISSSLDYEQKWVKVQYPDLEFASTLKVEFYVSSLPCIEVPLYQK